MDIHPPTEKHADTRHKVKHIQTNNNIQTYTYTSRKSRQAYRQPDTDRHAYINMNTDTHKDIHTNKTDIQTHIQQSIDK